MLGAPALETRVKSDKFCDGLEPEQLVEAKKKRICRFSRDTESRLLIAK
jgi:hypothetical protein